MESIDRFMDIFNRVGSGALKADTPENLRNTAKVLLPVLEDFIANDLPSIRFKARAAHKIFAVTPFLVFETLLEPYAEMIRALSRTEIEDKMKAAATALTSGGVGKKAAAAGLEPVDTQDLVTLATAADNVLPPRLRAFLLDSAGHANLSVEERFARVFGGGKTSLSAADAAQASADMAAKFPLSAVADYTHSTLQNISAPRMKSVLKKTFNAVSAQELDDYLYYGAQTALDACRAAAEGKNILRMENTGNAKKLGDVLPGILAAIEDAVITERGFLPDAAALQTALKNARGPNTIKPA